MLLPQVLNLPVTLQTQVERITPPVNKQTDIQVTKHVEGVPHLQTNKYTGYKTTCGGGSPTPTTMECFPAFKQTGGRTLLNCKQ